MSHIRLKVSQQSKKENLGSHFVLAISRSSLFKYGEPLKKTIPEIMVSFAVYFFPKKNKKKNHL
jgi:hypothetical protein